MIHRTSASLLLMLGLMACQPGAQPVSPPQPANLGKDIVVEGKTPAPVVEGECWEKSAARLVPPGTAAKPATDADQTAKPATIRVRVPCAEVMTPEFIASLQRALQARGLYRGAVTGTMDTATQDAVRRYQRALGLDLPVLTLASAQSLGLVPVALDDL